MEKIIIAKKNASRAFFFIARRLPTRSNPFIGFVIKKRRRKSVFLVMAEAKGFALDFCKAKNVK